MNRTTWYLLVLLNVFVWITQTAVACFVSGLMRCLRRGESQWALHQLEITENRNQWLIEEGKKLGFE